MCEQGKIMRLCACDGSTVDQKNAWKLFSVRNSGPSGPYFVGRFLPPQEQGGLEFLVMILFLLLVLPLYLLILLYEFLSQKLTLLFVARFVSEKHNLLYQLNKFNVFDFEYEPENYDTLSIAINNKHYHFEFRRGSWVLAKTDVSDLLMKRLVAKGAILKK